MNDPHTLLLGRYDDAGTLHLVARTTPLNTRDSRNLGRQTTRADTEHPWYGRHFSTRWGTSEYLEYRTVSPVLVAEFVADTSVDAGRYRHPVRFLRVREDFTAEQVQPFGS
ncbi:hypothetical protein ACFU96_43270 [Streptomyces sp. NPDC057620]|uniref:hypothetical protein n=1 Tax=Streptomyces sp. NPDC057620 TaxID=3346185 RepID=UPI0036CE5D1A